MITTINTEAVIYQCTDWHMFVLARDCTGNVELTVAIFSYYYPLFFEKLGDGGVTTL